MKTNTTARLARTWQGKNFQPVAMPICPVAGYIGSGDSWGVFALLKG